jgi:putative Mg2+ transporter-C (MgtC) family protein
LSPWRIADVQANENLLVHSPDGMAKVIEGLITGIGFIGGGAILKQGNSVHGIATARVRGPQARSEFQ